MPASRAIAATVSGRSPESTFSSTPWRRNHSTVARACGRSCSASRTSPCARRALGFELLARAEGEHAPPVAGRALGLGCERAELEVLGRAEDVADAAEPERAEAAARGERHLLRGLLGPGWIGGSRSPRACGCAPTPTPRSGRARSGSAVAGRRPRPHAAPARSASPSCRGRATSTEASDSIAFSCCASAPRRAMRTRRDGEGEAREQDQPLGDERDDRGDRGRNRLVAAASAGARARSRARSRAAPSRRRARTGAGSARARAASAGGGTSVPRRSIALGVARLRRRP